MKSNRSTNKLSTKLNKSFKQTKNEASFLQDETQNKAKKLKTKQDQSFTFRGSNLQQKVKQFGAANLRLKNMVQHQQPIIGVQICKRNSVCPEGTQSIKRDLNSRNNSNYFTEDRSMSRFRSGSKEAKKSKSRSKKRKRTPASSSKSKSKEKNEQFIESFFEKEYKEMQNEVLSSKGQIYEQKYKIDTLKQKLAKSDTDLQQLKIKFQKEKQKCEEYFNRSEKYREKVKELEEDSRGFERELKDLISSKNKESDILRTEVDNLYKQLKQKDEIAFQMIRDMPYYLNSLKQLLGQDALRNTNLKKVLNEILLIGEKLKEMFQCTIEQNSISQSAMKENPSSSRLQSLDGVPLQSSRNENGSSRRRI